MKKHFKTLFIIYFAIFNLPYLSFSQWDSIPRYQYTYPPVNVVPTGGCDPIITGPLSMCNVTNVNLTATYTITNYDPNGNYQFYCFPDQLANLNNNITIDPLTGEFVITFLSPHLHYFINVVFIDANGCVSSIDIEITPCCTDPLLFLDNGTPDQVSGALYDQPTNTWFVQNEIISLSGTFEIINSNMHFNNCMILMGPGAEIVVHQGSRLSITGGSEVMAACDIMWKGIYVRDGGEVYMAGNTQSMSYTFFKDAEYALKFEKNASYAMAKFVQFERCYVNFYFPPLSGAQHIIQPLDGDQNQWYNSMGTEPGGYTWFYKLLDPYPGQTGYSNDRMSFAGVLMYDVTDFSLFSNNYIPTPGGAGGVSFIYRYNFGIKAHNSNLYLKNFIISQQTAGQTKFSNIGIYADAPAENNNQYQIDIDSILIPLPGTLIMYNYTSRIWGSRTSI